MQENSASRRENRSPYAPGSIVSLPADLGSCVEEGILVHFDPVFFLGTDEIAASAQDPAPFTHAVIPGNLGPVTAEHLALTYL